MRSSPSPPSTKRSSVAVQAKVEAIRRYQAETQQEIEAMTGAVRERALRGEL